MRSTIEVEPVRPWSFWGFLLRVVKFPFQVIAVFFAFIMLFGWMYLAWLPLVAYTSNSDVFSMTLRCFDYSTGRPVEPLFLILKESQRFTAYNLRRPNRDDKHGAKPELFRECKRLVHSLWDMNDPVQRKGVLDWGETLMRQGLYLADRRNADSLPKVTERGPASEDEVYVMVGMALLGLHVEQNEDLYSLEELAQRAYPDPKDRERALAWAGTLYDRLEKLNADFQKQLAEESTRSAIDSLSEVPILAVLPPRTPKTLWWLVYQYVGLTPTTRQQCLDHWKTVFSTAFPGDSQRLGEQIERERRAAGEPLPPTSPALAWVCLVERYLGLDRKGEQDRAALTAFYSRSSLGLTQSALQFTNPSDEFFFVLFGSTGLHLTSAQRSEELSGSVMLTLTVVYGLRLLTFSVIGEFFLGLHEWPEYRRYRNGRGHGSFRVRLLGYVGIPLLAWGIAFVAMPNSLRPLSGSPLSMLVATFVGVLLGGALVGFLTRMVALLFLRAEVDVNRIWWDEIIGLTLGLGLLAYFGNDLVSLAIFATAELLPMCLQPQEPEVMDVQLVE